MKDLCPFQAPKSPSAPIPNAHVAEDEALVPLYTGQRDKCPECAADPHLKQLLALPHLEQVHDGLVTVGPHYSVLVLGVVKKSLQDGLDGLRLQGRPGLFICPPDHLLGNQPDVTGRVLQTL